MSLCRKTDRANCRCSSQFSRPRGDLSHGVGDGLAVLEGDEFGDVPALRVHQLAQLVQGLGAAEMGAARQLGKAACATVTAWSTSATEASWTFARASPVAGFQTVAERPEAEETGLPAIQ